jgi:hypothetical protein
MAEHPKLLWLHQKSQNHLNILVIFYQLLNVNGLFHSLKTLVAYFEELLNAIWTAGVGEPSRNHEKKDWQLDDFFVVHFL